MGTSATALERPLARLPWRAPPDALHRSWALNRPLTVLGVAMGLTLAAATAGLVLDPRVITGQPAWLKPAKFAVSIAIYAFTLVWLLGFVRGHGRWVGLVSWATAVALLGEMVVLVLQVVRGTASHFNVATPLDAALWNTMGGLIVVVWLMGLLAAALLLVQRFPEPVFAWGLRLGLAVALAGMAAGLLMTSPTPPQRAGRPRRAGAAHRRRPQRGRARRRPRPARGRLEHHRGRPARRPLRGPPRPAGAGGGWLAALPAPGRAPAPPRPPRRPRLAGRPGLLRAAGPGPLAGPARPTAHRPGRGDAAGAGGAPRRDGPRRRRRRPPRPGGGPGRRRRPGEVPAP